MNNTKRVLQCTAQCPICAESWGGKDEKTEEYTPQPPLKETRCLGGRGHEGLHQCKKHAWGTLEQRGRDLENVSGRTGRYINWTSPPAISSRLFFKLSKGSL